MRQQGSQDGFQCPMKPRQPRVGSCCPKLSCNIWGGMLLAQLSSMSFSLCSQPCSANVPAAKTVRHAQRRSLPSCCPATAPSGTAGSSGLARCCWYLRTRPATPTSSCQQSLCAGKSPPQQKPLTISTTWWLGGGACQHRRRQGSVMQPGDLTCRTCVCLAGLRRRAPHAAGGRWGWDRMAAMPPAMAVDCATCCQLHGKTCQVESSGIFLCRFLAAALYGVVGPESLAVFNDTLCAGAGWVGAQCCVQIFIRLALVYRLICNHRLGFGALQ